MGQGLGRRCAPFTNIIPITPVDSLEKYRRFGRPAEPPGGLSSLLAARSYKEDLSILIAGCGHLRRPNMLCVGLRSYHRHRLQRNQCALYRAAQTELQLDISRSAQLPIEQVSDLNMSFDQIICTGFHHLADPDAGLRALAGVLKPDGAMHLMVYALTADWYLYAAGIRQTDRIHANDKEIRISSLRYSVATGHPLEICCARPGFPPGGGLADALLNPQDRSYSCHNYSIHRKSRTDIRPVAKTSTLQRSLRSPSKDPAGFPDRKSFLRRTVCRCRTISRHNGTPQRGCLPRR